MGQLMMLMGPLMIMILSVGHFVPPTMMIYNEKEDEDDICEDWRDEMTNWSFINEFSRD